jgi:hypothetical protein
MASALYDSTLLGARRGILPTRVLRSGHKVYRGVAADQPYTHAYGAATIPPHSSTAAANRWSGVRTDASQGHGALYLGSSSAMMAEMYHYHTARIQSPYVLAAIASGACSIDHAFMDKRVFEYETRPALEVLDISRLADFAMTDPTVRKLSQAMGESIETLLDDDDHAFARAVAHAVHDASVGLAGISARTARRGQWHHLTDRSFDGENVVLFGNDSQVMHRELMPARVWRVSDIVNGKAAVSIRDLSPGDLLASLAASGVRS